MCDYEYSDLGHSLSFFSKFQQLRAVVMANALFCFSKANITWAGSSIVYSIDVHFVLYKPATYSLKKSII